MLCASCGKEINSSPMYARIEASINEAGEVVVETKYYHKPQCLIWLFKSIEKQYPLELIEEQLFRSSN